jgi:putative ABC transport system permease protein
MSVLERTGEFGTMRALGNQGRFVVRLILGECFLLGLVGASVGVAGGVLIAALISWLGIPMPPPPNSNAGYTARILIELDIIWQAALVGVAAAVLSGVLPALRMRRVAIVDALRTAV